MSVSRLAKKLREARVEKGYTQEEVAEHLHVTRLSLWGMENGKRGVAAGELYQLARFYGRSLEEFFTEEVQEEDLLYSFREYGYPVFSAGPMRSCRLLDPTTLVLHVLTQSPDPRLVEGLPVVFLTQTLNYDWIYHETVRQGLQNRLGLVTELTLEAFERQGVVKDREALQKLLWKLEKVKLKRGELFQKGVPVADSLSQKWGLSSNFPLASVTQWVFRAKKNQSSLESFNPA